MEYYMGRSLTNAMVNLNVDSEVEEALFEVSKENDWELRSKFVPTYQTLYPQHNSSHMMNVHLVTANLPLPHAHTTHIHGSFLGM